MKLTPPQCRALQKARDDGAGLVWLQPYGSGEHQVARRLVDLGLARPGLRGGYVLTGDGEQARNKVLAVKATIDKRSPAALAARAAEIARENAGR